MYRCEACGSNDPDKHLPGCPQAAPAVMMFGRGTSPEVRVTLTMLDGSEPVPDDLRRYFLRIVAEGMSRMDASGEPVADEPPVGPSPERLANILGAPGVSPGDTFGQARMDENGVMWFEYQSLLHNLLQGARLLRERGDAELAKGVEFVHDVLNGGEAVATVAARPPVPDGSGY